MSGSDVKYTVLELKLYGLLTEIIRSAKVYGPHNLKVLLRKVYGFSAKTILSAKVYGPGQSSHMTQKRKVYGPGADS